MIVSDYYICNLDDREEEFSSQIDNTYHGKPQEIEVNVVCGTWNI